MSLRRTLAIGLCLMALTPAGARADGLLIPFAGFNFGGDAGQTLGGGADAKRFDSTEVAWNFGGGLMVFFGTHAGIRGDIRYFRTFQRVDFGPIEIPSSDAVDTQEHRSDSWSDSES
jgi:hypothetical protein